MTTTEFENYKKLLVADLTWQSGVGPLEKAVLAADSWEELALVAQPNELLFLAVGLRVSPLRLVGKS